MFGGEEGCVCLFDSPPPPRERFSLCRPYWPGAQFVEQSGLDLPASAFQILDLRHMPLRPAPMLAPNIRVLL